MKKLFNRFGGQKPNNESVTISSAQPDGVDQDDDEDNIWIPEGGRTNSIFNQFLNILISIAFTYQFRQIIFDLFRLR